MECPKCKVMMREREQGNVIIDICPQCRGVWLDPGELEKLGERERRYYDDDDHDDDDDDDDGWNERRRSGRIQERTGSRGSQGRRKQGFLASFMENFGGEGGND